MQASTTVTPTAGYCGIIFVAIELSQKTWLVTLHSPERDRISRHKLTGGDHGGLLALIEQVRARAAGKLGAVPAVTSCYQAGYDGFWLHRLLEADGIRNFVFDAASIAVEQRSVPTIPEHSARRWARRKCAFAHPTRRHTLSSACTRSSIKSSACSSPVEKRIKPSLMPSSARASGFRR